MRKTIILLMVLFGICNVGNAKTNLIPLKDFFRKSESTGYKLSPNGKYLSYVAPYEHRQNIFVQKIGTNEKIRITSEKDRDISGYFWGNDSTILYGKDFNGDENYHLLAATIDGGHAKDLTPFEKVRAEVIDDLPDDDLHVIIGLNKRNAEVTDPYLLNISTGEMILLAENPGDISGWITDHDGKLRIATTTDGVNTALLYRKTEKDTFKTVITTSFKEALQPLFFTFDNKNLYALSNIGRDKAAIVKFDLETGKETEVVYQHPDVDIDDLNFSRKRHVLTTITYITDKEHYKFLDEAYGQLYKNLSERLKGYQIAIASKDKNEDKFIVKAYSDRNAGTYYLYDNGTGKLTKLNDTKPWLNENELAEMKPISYTTRDGMTINGYLTLPKGKKAKNLPVVIHPHGGPWGRDEWEFDPEVQFLANRGYAVLQMNFRGSTGYGKKFKEASYKQWGQNMQNDITDGINWLKEKGIADPKRIAIYGGSYGGYATLSAITLTPDVYACAIDYCGISNIFTWFRSFPPYWKPALDMVYEMVGNPQTDSTMLYNVSPAFHVDRIKCPLFVAQGKNDPRVNINESNQIVEALKKRGITVQYMIKDNEGHGFRNEENEFDFYTEMEKFLAANME